MTKTTPHLLVTVVEKLVEEDLKWGIPLHHKTNSSKALDERCLSLGVETHFKGDGKALRSIYSALRWLHEVQPKRLNL